MRQVWITKRGGPDVLQVREAPPPEPASDEVRIRVAAAGVNFADIMIRIGIYPHAPPLPAVVGYEVAGEVDAVGREVREPSAGTRVVALTPHYGGYGEYVTVPAGEAVPIPDHLSFEKAAAIPVNYVTAWLMLVHLGHVQPGERVLIHAVAGGIGQAALQIARLRGAEVYGTARAVKHARLRELGVAHTIDYTTGDFEKKVLQLTAGEGVDVVLDGVGGESFARSYRCLAPLGRLFMYGVSSLVPGMKRSMPALLHGLWKMPRFKPLDLIQKNRAVFGLSLGELGRKAERRLPILQELVRLVGTSVLDPVVHGAFRFSEAASAHQSIQRRENFGKVVLIP